MSVDPLYEHAVTLLARKDYCNGEMRRVLHSMTDDDMAVEVVLQRLREYGYLDDRRIAENMLSRFLRKQYGPVRIRLELRQRGIAREICENVISGCDTDWFQMAAESRSKKFGDSLPSEPKEKARQMRFLQSRGFTMDMITEAMTSAED